jgi:hypothetical protein
MSDSSAVEVDTRLYRIDQGLAAIALLAAFAFQVAALIPIWAIFLAASGWIGPAGAPTLLLITRVVPFRAEDALTYEPLVPRKMAASSEAIVLALAFGANLIGIGVVGALLTLITAGFCAFDAATGQCSPYLLAGQFRRHR